MKLKNSAALTALVLLAACGGGERLAELPPAPMGPVEPADVPPSYAVEDGAPPRMPGPQGTSRGGRDAARYDQVGYAGYAGAGEGVYALSATLPVNSFAEVTALNTGKTILIRIRGTGQGLLELSGAAAKQLGVTGNPPVRVRQVNVTPQDAALLTAGQAAPPRADAPPALLSGLRKRLGAQPAPATPAPPPVATPPRSTVTTPSPRPAPPPAPRPPVSADRGLFVQVAALSNLPRARSLANELGGIVRSGDGVHRIQIGPYATTAQAERARADVARRGYPDARIVTIR
ncbi:MAG: SPOR domain-containing protein [Alphaproteobacteria bacterium HGW-Alphaproteobacteria-16]|nr:MAG: SPOR domain-containing protein [Alphaproteobacteria bacterium HGW-Alphaproteobacteria-16]